MDKIVIRGKVPLKGEVKISGAKNAALPVLAASILTEGPNQFSNIPRLKDIETFMRLLERLGVELQWEGMNLRADAHRIRSCEAPYELVKTMRASILVLGPLLARMGRARVSLPGGCAIGPRPIDLHLKGLEALGAKIELKGGYIEARAKELRGTKIYLDISTVGGTENLMMASTLAKGQTILENAACEPEVEDLAHALNKMGAKISGAGTDMIFIEGVSALKPVQHHIISDRIEAGTFMIAAAISRGEVKVLGYNPAHLEAVINKLREAGVKVVEEEDGMLVSCKERASAVDIKTLPYPGFPTDMQAQIMALMTLAKGTSIIRETVFENRFMHVSELKRLGADIDIEGHSAIVRGIPRLNGAPVMATDLRASASLILAALAAHGVTEVSRIYHLDRGYEGIEKKLSQLGADIQRVKGVGKEEPSES